MSGFAGLIPRQIAVCKRSWNPRALIERNKRLIPKEIMSTSHPILLVTRNFPPLLGGMERLNQHLLRELEREYEVHLVGPNGATDHVSHRERVRTCPSAPVYAFLAYAALKRE